MKVLIIEQQRLSKLNRLKEAFPSVEYFIVVNGENTSSEPSTCYTFSSFSQETYSGLIPESRIGKDLVAILYTSGSTGRAKGVMITHANILAGASIVSTYLHITHADRILAILPFTFDAGLNQLTTSFQQGGTIILMSFLFAKEIVQMLKKEKITGLAGVPTLWNLLVQPSSTLSKTGLPHLRYITNTGGAMPQSILEKLQEQLSTTHIYLMYGLTEAFRSTYLPPDQVEVRPSSIGKAIPNTEIFLVSPDGKPCKPGRGG